MCETGVFQVPNISGQNLNALALSLVDADSQSSSDFIRMAIEYRTASTSGGVASATYSSLVNIQKFGGLAETLQSVSGNLTPTANNFYQFRLLFAARGVDGNRRYGNATITVLSTVR
jgi:hypothetical protein